MKLSDYIAQKQKEKTKGIQVDLPEVVYVSGDNLRKKYDLTWNEFFKTLIKLAQDLEKR